MATQTTEEEFQKMTDILNIKEKIDFDQNTISLINNENFQNLQEINAIKIDGKLRLSVRNGNEAFKEFWFNNDGTLEKAFNYASTQTAEEIAQKESEIDTKFNKLKGL